MGRRTLVLVIAVALAAISGFAIWQYLSNVEGDIRAGIDEVSVYRATASIEAGTTGEEAKAFIEESSALRESVVFDGSTILCTGATGDNADEDPNQYGCPSNPRDLNAALEGKVAAGPISRGQLITTESFADTRDLQQRLKDAIAEGKVAISLNVDVAAASGGFIRPGDRVNLLASASLGTLEFLEIISNDELRDLLVSVGVTTDEPAGPTTEPDAPSQGATPEDLAAAIPSSFDVTQTILQDIEVLAVGEDTRPAPLDSGLTPTAGVVVFEVTPQQAELIEYARNYTQVALSLLPAGAYVPYDAQPVVVDDLFGLLDRISAELGLVTGGTGN